jgi:acetyltransferase
MRLADGSAITIRPIAAGDAAIEQEFVRGLSDESRYFRFLDALRELSPVMLKRFTDIDYSREMALIAVAHEDGREHEIAVARYVAGPDPAQCEFAIAVADAWQGKGVAHRLLRDLIGAARAQGLRRLFGDVLAANSRMLKLVGGCGFEIHAHPEDTRLKRVVLDLAAGTGGPALC